MSRGPRALARRALARLAGSEPLQIAAPLALLELAREGPAPLELAREGPAPLAPPAAGADRTRSLRIAVVVPSFRAGSGGHTTLARLIALLQADGHDCSIWIEDDQRRHADERPAAIEARFHRLFGAPQTPVHAGFAGWRGADVAVATGWQTVARTLRLPGCAARAYLVQDHEPEFYGTSAEAQWAADTYRMGLHCIAASPWLAALLRERYGASTSHFDLGVDHHVYRPGSQARHARQVLFYARAVTPRRAVALGLLALTELARRRPDVEIALFGEARPLDAAFAHVDLGVISGDSLAEAYRTATVGMALSMTNPSLVPLEMLACELPCVDLASDAMLATFGREGPIELVEFDPVVLADALERLLDDPAQRALRARLGRDFTRLRTWESAADQVAHGLAEAARLARGTA